MPRQRKKPTQPETPTRSAVQPKRAGTGLPQGMHKQLMDAQAEVPMANAEGRMNNAIQLAQAQPAPVMGPGDAMLQPTARPDEHPMAGAPMGPGPGPEAIPAPIVPTTQDDWGMAKSLPMLEMLADMPTTSAQTRNIVRRIRGSLPPTINVADTVRQHAPEGPPGGIPRPPG